MGKRWLLASKKVASFILKRILYPFSIIFVFIYLSISRLYAPVFVVMTITACMNATRFISGSHQIPKFIFMIFVCNMLCHAVLGCFMLFFVLKTDENARMWWDLDAALETYRRDMEAEARRLNEQRGYNTSITKQRLEDGDINWLRDGF